MFGLRLMFMVLFRFAVSFFEGAFEIGNPRMGLYGNVYGSYNNSRGNYNFMSVTPEYTLDCIGKIRGESWNTSGDIMFKLMPSPNDYFAVKAMYKYNYDKDKQSANGIMYIDDVEHIYNRTGHGRRFAEVVSGSAYYKHKSRKESTLEITGNYDYSRSRPISTAFSTYGENEPVAEHMNYFNSRHIGNLNMTWDLSDARDNYWLTGVTGSMNLVNIRYFSGNISNYDNDQYSLKVFAGWAHAFFSKKLSVNFEASVENLWLSDAVYNRHYVYAGGRASFICNFNSKCALNVSYTLSNSAPALRYLNPYNTSTDPLFEVVGNPDLSPERHHNANANLYFSKDGWFITPSVSYRRDDNLAVQYGYFKPNGVYVYTFKNGGTDTIYLPISWLVSVFPTGEFM